MVVAILTANLEKIEAWTDLFDLIEWHYFVFFFVIALLGPGPVSVDAFIEKEGQSAGASSPTPVNSQFHGEFVPALSTTSSSCASPL